jgi:hypothetical protein
VWRRPVHSTLSSATHNQVGGVPELAQLMRIGTFVDHGGANDDAEKVAGTSAVQS